MYKYIKFYLSKNFTVLNIAIYFLLIVVLEMSMVSVFDRVDISKVFLIYNSLWMLITFTNIYADDLTNQMINKIITGGLSKRKIWYSKIIINFIFLIIFFLLHIYISYANNLPLTFEYIHSLTICYIFFGMSLSSIIALFIIIVKNKALIIIFALLMYIISAMNFSIEENVSNSIYVLIRYNPFYILIKGFYVLDYSAEKFLIIQMCSIIFFVISCNYFIHSYK